MGKAEVVIETIIATASKINNDKSVKSLVCGTYSDGTPRSIPDAIMGELYSPKQKSKAEKKKKKKKKKKKSTKFKL